MAGLTWSDQETYDLICIWAADQDLLDGTSRNNKVYESMAAQMRSLGYLRTTLQVKEKMKRLRKEYKYGKRNRRSPPITTDWLPCWCRAPRAALNSSRAKFTKAWVPNNSTVRTSKQTT
ncbi:hypothetical protein HPB51_009638 [Rhipicephalus microplus]|uniref:Myb/SANT-like DNA-binding domain-containing protein n=1 Tax=Rhipicephalus microplus TaxID=6941 RepID=A0A9J6D9M8_RHIMP|nr:hypothetical protein HPB51_009638 [Rhipicephalus microplus]